MSDENEIVLFSFFFFKQKTAYEIVDCDWSSDVCSSDLQCLQGRGVFGIEMKIVDEEDETLPWDGVAFGALKDRKSVV